jgi:hypothetical protein
MQSRQIKHDSSVYQKLQQELQMVKRELFKYDRELAMTAMRMPVVIDELNKGIIGECKGEKIIINKREIAHLKTKEARLFVISHESMHRILQVNGKAKEREEEFILKEVNNGDFNPTLFTIALECEVNAALMSLKIPVLWSYPIKEEWVNSKFSAAEIYMDIQRNQEQYIEWWIQVSKAECLEKLRLGIES